MAEEAFLAECLALAAASPENFERERVVRLYELAGHPLRGAELPARVTLRPPIVEPLVAMARERLAHVR